MSLRIHSGPVLLGLLEPDALLLLLSFVDLL